MAYRKGTPTLEERTTRLLIQKLSLQYSEGLPGIETHIWISYPDLATPFKSNS
jgi:hypothetical protein